MWTSPSLLPANRIAVSVVPMPSSSGSASTCAAIAELPSRTAASSLAEQVAAGLVVVEVGQRGDHQLRGDLAGGVAAHAVGQRQQPRAGVHRVLVVGADQAAVAARRVSKDQCHGRSSITVLPIRTGVPIGTRTAVVTFALSRYVPLVDPRSSTYHSEPAGDSRACRVEA